MAMSADANIKEKYEMNKESKMILNASKQQLSGAMPKIEGIEAIISAPCVTSLKEAIQSLS